MKRIYIITLLLSLCSVLCYGQHSFFDKYAEEDGVNTVYISKTMLSLFPKGQTNINGINVGDIASRLENIQILSTDNINIIAKLRKETSDINTQNGYEELMRIKEDNERTIIYFKDAAKEKKKEFVLLTDEKDEFTIISIVGDLNLQEIQGIINNIQ